MGCGELRQYHSKRNARGEGSGSQWNACEMTVPTEHMTQLLVLTEKVPLLVNAANVRRLL